MLSDADAIATVAVKDLEVARRFYQEKLGMKPAFDQDGGVLTLTSGKSKIFVYVSQYAGTNKATSATWIVRDADAEVASLRSRGVEFEHYDLPGLTRKGDLHVAGSFKGAWLKDPDGNILHILSR